MIYFIEEVLKVYINNMLMAFINVLHGLLHTLVSGFARTESIAVRFEPVLKQRCDGLCNTLLQPPVTGGWNAQ